MKKILIGISILISVILVALIIALLSISSIVTPDFIVKQIESSLNVRADLKKVNIHLFTALSSIELEGISLHNRDRFADNATLLSERTATSNPVIYLQKVDLKVNFLALLRKNFQLKNFVLIGPSVSVILKENGNNLSHLFLKPKIVEGKPNPALEEKEEVKTEEKSNEPEKPFSIKTLPISANIDKVGIENGTIEVFIQKTLQKVLLKNVNLLLTEIDIHPEDLVKHNSVRLIANMNLAVLNSGGQETALFKIASTGLVIPFVPKTGFVNPSVNYHLTLKQGSYIDGLSLLDALSGSLPILANAGIKMEGLSKKADLTKDVNLDVNYSSGKITFLNEFVFQTQNYDLTIEKDCWFHSQTNEHLFKGGVLASKVESGKAILEVDALIKKQLKIENPIELRNKILGNLIKNDRMNLPFTSTGNIKAPNVQLDVSLPSILDLAKDVIGDKVKDKIKDEIKKKLPPGVEDTINKGLKKLF